MKRSHFLPSNNEKGRFSIQLASTSRPAERNVFLLYQRYRFLKRYLHTICPDSLHYCTKSEQCCRSIQFGYTCSPKQSKCCESNGDTFCQESKECSSDGKFCV
ncbi:unnamed protein product [Heterobilharzia americana]|nr:unnamed protein product [Heterobilharzia americana]